VCQADDGQGIRGPLGVYAHVDIEFFIRPKAPDCERFSPRAVCCRTSFQCDYSQAPAHDLSEVQL
jgi:hypothetical protein